MKMFTMIKNMICIIIMITDISIATGRYRPNYAQIPEEDNGCYDGSNLLKAPQPKTHVTADQHKFYTYSHMPVHFIVNPEILKVLITSYNTAEMCLRIYNKVNSIGPLPDVSWTPVLECHWAPPPAEPRISFRCSIRACEKCNKDTVKSCPFCHGSGKLTELKHPNPYRPADLKKDTQEELNKQHLIVNIHREPECIGQRVIRLEPNEATLIKLGNPCRVRFNKHYKGKKQRDIPLGELRVRDTSNQEYPRHILFSKRELQMSRKCLR